MPESLRRRTGRTPKDVPGIVSRMGSADAGPGQKGENVMAQKKTKERERREREEAWAQMVDKLVFLGEMEAPEGREDMTQDGRERAAERPR